MKKMMKVAGLILGALVLGAFLGWCFNMAGYETSVTVAVILALFAGIEPMIKAKKQK